MNAFAAGMTAIFSDPNIGMDVWYQSSANATPVKVRGVKFDPSAQVPGMASMGVTGRSLSYDILQSAVPDRPTASALVSFDGVNYYPVKRVENDSRSLYWELTLGK